MAELTRIVIADDHALLRGALAEVLHLEERFEVVAEAGDGNEVVAAAREFRPDLVLLDIEMPHNDPPVTVERILEASPETQVIVLTMHDGDAALVHALVEKGIKGFLHKDVTRSELVSAIDGAAAPTDRITISASRETFIGARRDNIAQESTGERVAPAEEGPLSQRELQILTYVGAALSNRQIATRLGITEGTVKRHLRNIFQKMGAVSRIDAYNKAVAAALLPYLVTPERPVPERSPLRAQRRRSMT
ncbi:response regulator transcription factor [Streptomyces decoyicus]|uniref:response regulator n=1 Tax=Streptomyces decoyicus TaxID=249567 RepID=UPI00345DC952